MKTQTWEERAKSVTLKFIEECGKASFKTPLHAQLHATYLKGIADYRQSLEAAIDKRIKGAPTSEFNDGYQTAMREIKSLLNGTTE